MIVECKTFSPLRITHPFETESNTADAELLVAEEILTALCNTEDGIAACATLLGYGNGAPTTRPHH
ncbi:MAG: hypothetical protein Q8Q81_11885 [Oxalobacteraceae bacterium]|nr:hypothetical protein [Oxalobacteraceae bacterium]